MQDWPVIQTISVLFTCVLYFNIMNNESSFNLGEAIGMRDVHGDQSSRKP